MIIASLLKKRRPLGLYLLWLVLLAVVPLALVSSVAFVIFAHHQQRAAEDGLLETTRAMAIYTELRVQADIERLEVLARSDGIVRGDLRRFSERIHQEVEDGHFLGIALLDLNGRVRTSTTKLVDGADAQTLPQTSYVRYVVETRQPYVSDVVISPLTGGHGVVVAVPVLRVGRVAYVLIATPNATAGLLELFAQQRLPPSGIGTIMDRQGWYVARTLNPKASLGHRANEGYRARALASKEGIVKSTSREGEAVYATFVQTSFGWITALALPASIIEAPYRRALYTMGALWLCGLTIGALMAILFGTRISAALRRLAMAATEVGEGHIPPARLELIKEVDVVRSALVQAAEQREKLLAEHTRARNEADVANRAKDEFLAMLGHELRNPLGAISNAVSVLNLKGQQDDTTAHMRQVIERQVTHLSILVRDLLDAGRVATGKMDLVRRPMNLTTIVRSAVETLATQGVRLNVSVKEDIWINADETRIEQVVGNLLSNALKYTPAGGSIDVRLERTDDRAVLIVRDTGIGISPELLPRVFELFVQGERTLDRGGGGLGIGLTLVRRLAELHGGSVEAASEGSGKGATFTLTLPLIEKPSLAAAKPLPLRRAGELRRRILIVEDNVDNREMLRTALGLLGHTVFAAPDGPTGLAMANAEKPDVALIDIGLPGMNGYEVAKQMRRTPAFRDIHLVALTGYEQAEHRAQTRDAGFDAHLIKPVKQAELEAILARDGPSAVAR
jgi:signal transduction histidine kinase/ActR/RegA family two-component response regulator